jgi:peptidoglycan/LPS O-acetylase OafA/YrhL
MKNLRQAENLCLAVFFLSAIFRVIIWTWHPDPFSYNQFLPSRAGELALGGYLAMRFRGDGWRGIQSWTPPVMVLSLIGFVSVCLITHDVTGMSTLFMEFGLPCITLFLAGLLVLSLSNGVATRLFNMGWLRWIGGISYGVYVFHVVLIFLYEKIPHLVAPHASRNASLIIIAVCGFILTLLISWLSFRFFESPFLRLKHRFQTGPSIQLTTT